MLVVTLALLLLISPYSDDDMVATVGNLNVNQVYQLLLNNGANQSEAANLAGISVYEAGGGNPLSINPNAVNNNVNTQDYSVGLFQYNFRGAGFNASNPMASSRGGFTPTQLLGSLDAQAQSALALLRGSPSGYGNWTTYRKYTGAIQNIASQLLGTSSPQPVGGGTTDTPSPLPGSGIDTSIPSGINSTIPNETGGQSGVQGTTQATTGSNVPPPTGLNLSFAGSIQHVIFQFLLVIIGIALLLGGIYLLGSHK